MPDLLLKNSKTIYSLSRIKINDAGIAFMPIILPDVTIAGDPAKIICELLPEERA